MNYDALYGGFALIMALLFVFAWIGMSGPIHRSAGRSPDHPPGYKNKRKRKIRKLK